MVQGGQSRAGRLVVMADYYVYIMASHSRTLYVGLTNDLQRRVWQHKTGALEGFTKKYQVKQLVYIEQTSDPDAAIAREKQLKRWSRARKYRLIEEHNAGWRDLGANLEVIPHARSACRDLGGGSGY
jgi:putative endonuclease